MKISDKKKLFLLFFAAFLLAFLAQAAVFAFNGIYPFGSKSILTFDMHNQYVSYFSYLRQVLKGKHSLLYTFSKTMGGDMYGFAAYYLISPLNFLLLFFDTNQLPLAIELITLVKIGLCALTCCICLYRFPAYSEKGFQPSDEADGSEKASFADSMCKAFMLLAFSCCYGLMSYNIANAMNLMWLDCVICFPLVILGIVKIRSGRNTFLYIISLGFALMTSFYIGYILCLGSVVFFLCGLPLTADNLSGRIKRTLVYAASSLLAGGIAMCTLLPSFFSLEGGNGGFNLGVLYDLSGNFSLRQLAEKALSGAGGEILVIDGMPNIYCSVLCLLFIWLFFLSGKISIRRKISAALLFLVMILSMYVRGFNLLWHGLNSPSWFLYRYSFIFSFFMILTGWQGYLEGHPKSAKRLLVSEAALMAVILALTVLAVHDRPDGMPPANVIANAAAALIFCILYLLFSFPAKPSGRRIIISSLFMVICLAELTVNGVSTQKSLYRKDHSSYVSFVNKTSPAVEYVKNHDDGLYRMEKTFVRKESDPMLLDYKGLSHYSSSDKLIVREFMGKAGFRNNGNWAYYNRGSTYAMDSFLGVKYILSKSELEEPYQLIKTRKKIHIYQNPYALPLALGVNSRVADGAGLSSKDAFDFNETHKFEFQNRLWKTLTGSEEDVFVPEGSFEVHADNLTEESPGYYRVTDSAKKAALTFSFEASSDFPIFGWFGTDERHPVRMFINGEDAGDYFSLYQYDIFRIGTHKAGSRIEIRLEPKDSDVLSVTDVWFYHQDMDVFEKLFGSLQSSTPSIVSWSDSRILLEAKGDEKNNQIMFTIPAEDGWTAKIDGKKAPVETAMDVFLSVPLPEGQHSVEISYFPKGLKAGISLTILSALLTIIWLVIFRKSFQTGHQAT